MNSFKEIRKAGLSGPEFRRDAATLLQTGTPTIHLAIQGTPSAARFGCPSSQRMLGEMKICLPKGCLLMCTCMRYYKPTRHRIIGYSPETSVSTMKSQLRTPFYRVRFVYSFPMFSSHTFPYCVARDVDNGFPRLPVHVPCLPPPSAVLRRLRSNGTDMAIVGTRSKSSKVSISQLGSKSELGVES